MLLFAGFPGKTTAKCDWVDSGVDLEGLSQKDRAVKAPADQDGDRLIGADGRGLSVGIVANMGVGKSGHAYIDSQIAPAWPCLQKKMGLSVPEILRPWGPGIVY